MEAYFVFEQRSPNGEMNEFIFKLTNQATISEARSILADQSSKKGQVQGRIVQSKAYYNPRWSFHLDPDSVSFFETQIEVCDANVTRVEEHLDEVGGSFLPRSFWCPWSSRLKAEVTAEVLNVAKPVQPNDLLPWPWSVKHMPITLKDLIGRTLRVVRSGETVTADFVPGRVTVYVNARHGIDDIKIEPEDAG